jgi:hypothetical protein
MKEVSDSFPKQRKLDDQTAARLIQLLKMTTNFQANIFYECQTETTKFAMQLKGVFESSGWSVSSFPSVLIPKGVPQSFTIAASQMPPPEVQNAIANLFDALHLPKAMAQRTNIPPNRLDISVGPQ